MSIVKGTVKGSRQDELVIATFQPEQNTRKRLLTGVALMVVGLGGFLGGWYGSIRTVESLAGEREELRSLLDDNEQTIADLTQQVGILQKGGEVDRVAADDVRDTIRDLRTQVTGLQEEVRFYRGIMVDDDGAEKGLRLNKVEIRPLQDQRARYSIMLSQVVDNAGYIAGTVNFLVVGQLKGKAATLELSRLDKQIDDAGAAFRFRYFQELTGDLQFPDGFIPSRIEITVKSSGKSARKIEQTLDWPT